MNIIDYECNQGW